MANNKKVNKNLVEDDKVLLPRDQILVLTPRPLHPPALVRPGLKIVIIMVVVVVGGDLRTQWLWSDIIEISFQIFSCVKLCLMSKIFQTHGHNESGRGLTSFRDSGLIYVGFGNWPRGEWNHLGDPAII